MSAARPAPPAQEGGAATVHVAHAPGFHEVIASDAQVEPLVTGLGITEGTVWHPGEQALVFSDLSASTVYRWREGEGASLLRRPSNITNGNYVDRQGRVLSCEHATSSVVRLEDGGRWLRVLASQYRGREFNSPNDIVCDRFGRIWFTDPLYGRTNPRVGVLREAQLGFQGVYRIEPDGAVTLLADDFEAPNGLCLSPGEDALFVNDSARGHIRRFRLDRQGRLEGGEVFATLPGDEDGKPDGMKVDADGRVYCTGAGGVHVLAPDGTPLGLVRTPAKVRNFCFGGADFRTLYLALHEGVWRVPLRARGLGPTLD
jgi:gluconolactonase